MLNFWVKTGGVRFAMLHIRQFPFMFFTKRKQRMVCNSSLSVLIASVCPNAVELGGKMRSMRHLHILKMYTSILPLSPAESFFYANGRISFLICS